MLGGLEGPLNTIYIFCTLKSLSCIRVVEFSLDFCGTECSCSTLECDAFFQEDIKGMEFAATLNSKKMLSL